jgi:SAM-dependent methyltransferase
MNECGPSAHSFHLTEYLEAKMKVDEKSINRSVLRTFKSLILKKKDPAIVDLGTGTGMMIRRLSRFPLHGDVAMYGVDSDQRCCAAAFDYVKNTLLRLGYAVVAENDRVVARKPGTRLTIHIVQSDMLDRSLQGSLGISHVQCVTANAFMDIIPLRSGMEHISELLEKGGIFYSTINYDGRTTLLPPWKNQTFEQSLLSVYDNSMDERLAGGLRTGGSRTGSLIFSAAQEAGLHVEDFGSSDWQLFPARGRYSKTVKYFLNSIVTMIYREGEKSSKTDRRELDSWYEERLCQTDMNALALITHQTDIVAVKPE